MILLCAALQGCALGIAKTTSGEVAIGPGLPTLSPGWLEATATALYFSTTTFTTTGHTELSPVGPLGQTLSSLESLLGFLLMALFMVCMVRKFGR